MNIKHILRNSILSCAMILGIFNSNIGNTGDYIYLHVNDKVFSHNVDIYYDDLGCISYDAQNRKLYIKDEISNKLRLIEDDKYERISLKPSYQNKYENIFKACDDSKDEYYNKEINCTLDVVYPDPDESDKMKNKFEELYNQRLANGIKYDLITYLEKMVSEIFGNDYKVPRNWRFDIESQYPENRQMSYKENDTKPKLFTRYFSGKFEDLMKNNNLELVTRVKYEWKGTAIDDITKGKEKNTVEESFDIDSIYNNIFEYANNKFIITNGNNVLYYDKKNNELRIYHKLNTDTDYCTDLDEVIKKFNKLGLLLQKRNKREEEIIKKVFGQDINLQYNTDHYPFS